MSKEKGKVDFQCRTYFGNTFDCVKADFPMAVSFLFLQCRAEERERLLVELAADHEKLLLSSGESVPYDQRKDLSCWFGLSYASWLTLPRVLMEAMPKTWQARMSELLCQYDDTFSNPPDIGTRVQVTQGGKLTKTPSWILNYRRPDRDVINDMRSKAEI